MPRFPAYRPRRLRRTAALRALVRETHLDPAQLVLPLFVRGGRGVRRAIEAMPGVVQHTRESLRKEVAELAGYPGRARAVGPRRLARPTPNERGDDGSP